MSHEDDFLENLEFVATYDGRICYEVIKDNNTLYLKRNGFIFIYTGTLQVYPIRNFISKRDL